MQCLQLEQVTSIVVQHSVEVVGPAVFFVDFAAVDHAAELHAVVWESVAAAVCAVFVADTVACSAVDVRAAVALECTAVYTAQGAPARCTVGDTAVVFG